jgi:hypothetical protein
VIVLLTGLIAGIVHVWSGPDHLAAVAPLALRSGVRPWAAGLRWGLGHSSGVAVVAVIALALRGVLPVALLSQWGERLVGLTLLVIGAWGLRVASRLEVHAHRHRHDGEEHIHAHVHTRPLEHQARAAHVHPHAALGVGILHGVAGSSHFLGVIPALALPTMTQSVVYIVAFGLGTIGAMGGFAGLIGRLAAHPSFDSTRAYRRLMAGCAVAAIVVGAVWIGQAMKA